MRLALLYSAAALCLAAMPLPAHAATLILNIAGPGVGGSIAITYGTATDAKYPQALEVTGITGSVFDTNVGLPSTTIAGLVPINHAAPEPGNTYAPNDFSKYLVAVGTMDGSLSFDNLFWPGGSPQTAPPTDYAFSGGLLDIYGLLFTLSNGDVVNLWSNGVLPGATTSDYGFALATHASTLDYTGGAALTPTPEPGSFLLLGTGILGIAGWGRSTLLRAKS